MGRDVKTIAVGARFSHLQTAVLDDLCAKLGYANRTEMVRDMLRQLAEQNGFEWPDYDFVDNERRKGKEGGLDWIDYESMKKS